LKEVSTRGGVSNILIGNFTKAGENFRINITLQEGKTGELIASERADGSGEQSFYNMVDDLTRKIKEDLKLTSAQIASDLDKEVGKITTSSPEAYKFYAEGRQYHNQVDYERSIESMEKAIALDPEFAMAYRSLSVSYSNLGKYKEANKYIQKALELSDRLTEREKLTIQGDYYSQSDLTYDKAIEAYVELLKLYPEDTIANHNLGLRYYEIEEWSKAIEYFNASLRADTDFILTYTSLANSYKRKGMYDKAIEVYEECIRKFPDDPRGHSYLGSLYALQGKYDLASNELDKAIAIDPTYSKAGLYFLKDSYTEAEKEFNKYLGLANERYHLNARTWLEVIYRTQGKYGEAEKQAQLGIELTQKLGLEQSNWRFAYHRILAYLYGRSGDFEKALNEQNNAWQMSVELPWVYDQIINLWIKGWIYSKMGSLIEAQKTAEELQNLIQNSLYKKHIRYYHQLMGLIALKKANYGEAIDCFEKTISLLPYPSSWTENHGFHMYYLALAYYESGDLERAREEYEKIVALTHGRMYWGDLYAKSFYMLGKICEAQKDRAKAIEYYEKFLDLWKDADAGVNEVPDAKKRLAGLKEL
jgi:pentatricopeptide repeat protein